jgi:hypothetical protein
MHFLSRSKSVFAPLSTRALRAVNLELLSLYSEIFGESLNYGTPPGTSDGRSTNGNKARLAASEASPPLTCGESNSSTKPTPRMKNSHHWCEKLAGPNLVILERCKKSAEPRVLYLERTKQFGWTKNVLIHQIENKT